jgi:hypothetical protein
LLIPAASSCQLVFTGEGGEFVFCAVAIQYEPAS